MTKKQAAAPAATTKTITIPGLRRTRLYVKIKGVTPLICNRFSEAKIAQIEQAQGGKAKIAKAPREPEREFEQARYLIDGRDYFPAIGLKRAMVSAGQRFADEKGTELLGAFTIPTQYLEILNPEPDAEDWPRMRTDIGRIGPSRTASPIYRPEYPAGWTVEIPIVFNANFISLDQLLNLLSIAGFSVGIGEWRTEKKGVFGQFEIAEVRVEEGGE